MSTPSPAPFANTTAPFSDPTPAPTSLPGKYHAQGLSKRTTIIITTAISAAVIFVALFGIVHYIRRRNRLKAHDQEQIDIEASLRRAQLPVLALDTDVPRLNRPYVQSASVPRFPILGLDVDANLRPLVRGHSAPPVFRVEAARPMNVVRGPTRNPLGSHPPGIGGGCDKAYATREQILSQNTNRSDFSRHCTNIETIKAHHLPTQTLYGGTKLHCLPTATITKRDHCYSCLYTMLYRWFRNILPSILSSRKLLSHLDIATLGKSKNNQYTTTPDNGKSMPTDGVIVAGCAGAVIAIVLITMVVTRDRVPFTFSRRNPPSPQPEDVEAQAGLSIVSEDFEVYGHLYIPPDRQPTHMGLDIINRLIMTTGLPTNATVNSTNSPATGSTIQVGLAPRISIKLPRPSSMTPSEQAQQIMTEVEASNAALDVGRSFVQSLKDAAQLLKAEQQHLGLPQQDKFAVSAAERIKAGKWTDVAREEAVMGKLIDQSEMQDVFVVGGENEEEEVVEDVAVHPMSFAFGTGKTMASLYR
ncbi:uncharacterized protein K460DRAFT_423349 [Cucurbitaria berberidis CBS 394.84]|uniref:Uncharacterized protein n=1 Tax=Cucurbitaria berberidis CBS 394.84 TaxID=1168544 RepID=A0A9P4GQL5_9PLEO|nr:uncharacterized protein K460DRAFT_423349 [Cucurbitaria berberidis CBS 394.84]KAF1850813.1 hypothetical protein K460DRAFT_423349 [Cucurbitaria berberidis CBS 394.84]